jgi:hypothetical protein
LLRVLVSAHVLADEPEGGLAAADLALGAGGTRLWETDIRAARAHFVETRRRQRPGAD